MGNCWTRPTTPSMQPNRLQISSIAGFLPVQQILTLSTSSLNSGANLLSYVSSLEKYRVTHQARTPPVLQLPVLHPSMQPFFGVRKALHLQHLRVLTLPQYHCQSVDCSKQATISCRSSLQQMAERTSSLRTKEEGSPRQFRQNGRVVGKTTG